MASKGKLPFCPENDGTHEENVAAFEDFARRRAKAFGKHLDFDGDSWDVTDGVPQREGRPSNPRRKILNFGQIRAAGEPLVPLSDVTRDFAKSFVRSARALRLTYDPLRQRCYAFAFLDAALKEEGLTSLCDCNAAVLNTAVRIVQERRKPTAAANVADLIREVARFLDVNGMVRVPLKTWDHGLKRPKKPDRDSAEFEARSEARLPKAEFLEAIVAAYRIAKHPMDVVALGTCILLLGVSGRINEALAIVAHCERECVDHAGRPCLGLLWPGSKRRLNSVKLVASDMAGPVVETLERLRAVTQEGRRIREWYGRHDTELYLPANLEHLRGRPNLNHEEAGSLLGLTPRSAHIMLHAAAKRRDPGLRHFRSGTRSWTFVEVERLILRRLPRSRMEVGTAREPLFVVNAGLLARYDKGACCPCMFAGVTYYHIAASLGMAGRHDSSVFTRMGLDPDKRLAGRSHSFRHLLHSLLIEGGLSPTCSALWAGRTDLRHNDAYDHVPASDVLSKLRQVDGNAYAEDSSKEALDLSDE